ncbi:hypothetical protein EDB81DRAFT_868488 [Dactylonectria macrodidyma]|uniref:Zn(2)-C6 fungal-type domain-containing protein n=1 Tax=Dactylonectria macrodidyma TaxID=307937 RepID=A0A9P9JDW6_9HYPO|nr:hypothetical protein EDB81DRAFT_868488 [Dactylonectria macrodidyma]
MQQLPGAKRRPRCGHSKSRNGCTNCKRRRVKCDEMHPVCSNCQRHEFACSLSQAEAPSAIRTELPYITTLVADLNPPSKGFHSDKERTSTPLLPSYQPAPSTYLDPLPPEELSRRSLELMHHYSTITASTLSLRQDVAYACREAIPREGYKHSFASHGILALAAAHKAHLIPNSRDVYLKLCDYHSMLGSKGFEYELQKPTEDNSMALFGFATLLILYSFTLPIRSTKQKLNNPIDSFCELASLIRGLKTTLSPLVCRTYNSELAPLIYGVWPSETDGRLTGYPPLDNTFLPKDLWDATSQLRCFLESEVPFQNLSHYRDAVDKLQYSARLISLAGSYAESGAITAWLHDIDERILADIAAYKPHALVLLVYFCVFLAGIQRNFWYARGWADQLFEKVETSLDGQDRLVPLLQWPRTYLELL